MQSRDEALLSRVKEAEKTLMQLTTPITQTAIAKLVGMSVPGLLYYPNVADYLRSLTRREAAVQEDTISKLTQDNAASRIRLASQQVVASGHSVGKGKIIEGARLSADVVNRHDVMMVIEGIVEESRKTRLEQRYQARQAELIMSAEKAIDTLTARGEKISQSAISRLVGVSIRGLRYYPALRVLLEQFGLEAKYRNNPPSEDALIMQAQMACDQLDASAQAVTAKAVCDIIEISYEYMRKMPRLTAEIRSLCEGQDSAKLRLRREQQLYDEVQKVSRELESEEKKITQVEISRRLRMSPAGLRKYPRVKECLIQLTRRASASDTDTADPDSHRDESDSVCSSAPWSCEPSESGSK